jgi:DNA-binding GntR family transcriptional regulator
VQIDHDAARFPFLQLADILRERIASGEYGPGAKLPTIDQVVRETGLSPMTIRRAVRVLVDEGLVEVVPGRGSFVINTRDDLGRR